MATDTNRQEAAQADRHARRLHGVGGGSKGHGRGTTGDTLRRVGHDGSSVVDDEQDVNSGST